MSGSSQSKSVLPKKKNQPEAEPGENSDDHREEDNVAATTPPDRTELVDQAAKWLEDETIKAAPIEEKVTFLRKKGLASEDITKLLEASSSLPESPSGEDSPPLPAAGAPVNSASNTTTTARPDSIPEFSSSTTRPTPPPIVTYPEALLRSNAPPKPPLVTLGGVASALYGAFAIGSGAYMTSKNIVRPMIDGLISARLDLGETAIRNLETMNEKLEGMVSQVPYALLANKAKRKQKNQEGNLQQSLDVDVGGSYRGSPSLHDVANTAVYDSLDSEHRHNPTEAISAAEKHTTNVQQLSSRLSEFLDCEKEETKNVDDARDRLTDVQVFLDRMAYSVPFMLNSFGYPISDHLLPFGLGIGAGTATDGPNASKDADGVSALRAEIRSVKGGLLNPKNFPNPSVASSSRSESPAKPWQQRRP